MQFVRTFSAIAFSIAMFAGATTASAETTFEAAKRTGKLTMGIYNQAPWGFRAPDGKISGQAVDVAVTAFQRMGIKEFDPVVSEFSALIPGLLAKRFDVIAAGLYITPERCKLVIFGNPDIRMPDGLLVRKGNPHKILSYIDIAKKPSLKIGTARGNAQAQNAVQSGVSNDQQLLFPDNQSGVAALVAGRVDAVSATAASIVNLLKDSQGADIERALPFSGYRDAQGNEKVGYPGLAFRPEDTDFRNAYSAELAKMRADGTLLAINKRYGFDESDLPPADKTAQSLCSS